MTGVIPGIFRRIGSQGRQRMRERTQQNCPEWYSRKRSESANKGKRPVSVGSELVFVALIAAVREFVVLRY